MMSTKCFAHILTSQEMSAQIKELTDEVLSPGGLTKAYNAIKKIAELNNSFYRQFKDTDPRWFPPEAQSKTYAKYQQQAKEQRAQNTQPQPAPAVAQVVQNPIPPQIPNIAYNIAYDDAFKC